MRLPRVPAGAAPPPPRWWGNAFYRVWKDWEQLVIVIRLPWHRTSAGLAALECIYGVQVPYEQLVVSWRRREGWRRGWRAA